MVHSLYNCKSSIKCWFSMLGSRNGIDNPTPFNTIVLELQLWEAIAWKWAVEPQNNKHVFLTFRFCVTSQKCLHVHAGAHFDIYFSPILIDIKEFSSNK
jgi:hypothetical protein